MANLMTDLSALANQCDRLAVQCTNVAQGIRRWDSYPLTAELAALAIQCDRIADRCAALKIRLQVT